MFGRIGRLIWRSAGWLAGGVMLGSEGCNVGDAVVDTLALALGIVDVWV